jgi:DNA-binding NarL/FixJ family response regulator
MTLRILIVDDHPAVRHGLKAILSEHPEWEVVAEAADGLEALDKVGRLNPDLVVLDVTMPKMSGLAVCRQIRENAPGCEVLMVTQHDSPQMRDEAMSCGARGYVVKTNVAKDLLAAVEAVSQHRVFVASKREAAEAD